MGHEDKVEQGLNIRKGSTVVLAVDTDVVDVDTRLLDYVLESVIEIIV